MTAPGRPLNPKQFPPPAAASRALPAGPITASNPHHGMPPPTHYSPQSHGGQSRPLPPSDQQQSSNDTHRSPSSGISSQHFAPQQPQQQSLSSNTPQQIPPVGFYSARAAPQVNSDGNAVVPSNIPKFDPHSESPSIRKTPGIDHNKTIPVKRGLAGATVATAPAVQDGIFPRTNLPRDFVNPSTDMHRRIGAPGIGMQSPGTMTGSAYRPPTRRGPDLSVASGTGGQTNTATRRAPLGDISNMQQSTTGTSEGSDPKRQRITGPENGIEGNHTASAG
jgi:DNA repair and recombination protein RAD52